MFKLLRRFINKILRQDRINVNENKQSKYIDIYSREEHKEFEDRCTFIDEEIRGI